MLAVISLHHRFDDFLCHGVVHRYCFIQVLFAFPGHMGIQVTPTAASKFQLSRRRYFEAATACFMGF